MIPGLFIYLYATIGLLVLYFDITKRPIKQYDKVFNIIYIILAVTAAFSYGVGPDTKIYMYYFESIPKLWNLSNNDFLYTRAQPLFVLTNSLCKTISANFLSLQLLQCFLLYHSLYLVLKKYRLKKFWVLFLFFGYCYTALLSGRRECFGLSFCLYAMLFYEDKRWLYYYTLVAIGFLFHTGMLVFALIPFIKIFKKISLRYIVIIFILFLSFQYLFQYLSFFSFIVNEGDSILKYSLANQESSLKLSTIILVLIRLSIIIIFIFYDKSKKHSELKKDFVYIGVVATSLDLLSASLPIIYRFRTHFAVFSYYTIYECFKGAKKNAIIIAIIFSAFAYSPIATFVNTMQNYESFYNYCHIFSNDEEKAIMDDISTHFDTSGTEL